MRRMWPAAHSRAALLCEHALCTSLIVIMLLAIHATVSTDEQVLRVWANGEGALIIFAAVHTWLTAPLCVVLAIGYLIRRAVAVWRSPPGTKKKGTERVALPRWPIWVIVCSSGAAFFAVIADAMLLALINLRAHNNMHWMLYPWGVMGVALIGVWLLRAVCYPQSTDGTAPAVHSDGDPVDRLWDWFGESVIAAAFSSLIVVVGFGGMHISDDPLTADLASIQPTMFAVALVPITLMIVRRATIRMWRRTRSSSGT